MLVFPPLLAEPWFLSYPSSTAKAAPHGLPHELRTVIDGCNGLFAVGDGGYRFPIPVYHRLFLRTKISGVRVFLLQGIIGILGKIYHLRDDKFIDFSAQIIQCSVSLPYVLFIFIS